MDLIDYREGVEETLDSLDRWLEELIYEVTYASAASVELLEGLRNVLERIRDRLPDVVKEYADEDLDLAQPTIRIGHILSFLHQVIFTISETSQDRTPAALVDSLRSVAQRYVDGDVVLLFRPGQRALEYTFIPFGSRLDQILGGAEAIVGVPLRDALKLSGKKIVLLSYPASEQNNVLLHSIFLHEIGHFITHEHNVPKKAFDACMAAAESLPSEFAGKPEAAVLDMQAILRRWLWELAADASAIRLVGPAYFFGIYRSMLVGEALDQYSREHPPAWLRLRMMLNQLVSAGYPEVTVLEKPLAEWDARLVAAEQRFRAQLPKAKLINVAGEAQDQALFRMTEKLLPFVVAEVGTAVNKDEYTAEHYMRECPHLVQQLREFIPLNEWYAEDQAGAEEAGTAAQVTPSGEAVAEKMGKGSWHVSTLAGILNAGWSYVIAGLDEAYGTVGAETSAERREFRRRIFALIAKSIELAQIQGDVAVCGGRLFPTTSQ